VLRRCVVQDSLESDWVVGVGEQRKNGQVSREGELALDALLDPAVPAVSPTRRAQAAEEPVTALFVETVGKEQGQVPPGGCRPCPEAFFEGGIGPGDPQGQIEQDRRRAACLKSALCSDDTEVASKSSLESSCLRASSSSRLP